MSLAKVRLISEHTKLSPKTLLAQALSNADEMKVAVVISLYGDKQVPDVSTSNMTTAELAYCVAELQMYLFNTMNGANGFEPKVK